MFIDQKKFAYFLPNTFTALNMACGFVGLISAMMGDFYKASMLIFLATIFDSVDGRVARMTNTQSSFGEQFDSLSDLVSFGVAPALIFYFRFLTSTGRLGLICSFLFVLCGALRLARFNATIDRNKSDYFQGLPIPGAAAAIVGYVLLSLNFPIFQQSVWYSIAYLVFYAILMISNIPFPSFKKSEWIKNHKKQALMIVFIILASIFLYEEVMIPCLTTFYVVTSLLYYLTHRSKFAGIFEWQDEPEDQQS